MGGGQKANQPTKQTKNKPNKNLGKECPKSVYPPKNIFLPSSGQLSKDFKHLKMCTMKGNFRVLLCDVCIGYVILLKNQNSQ